MNPITIIASIVLTGQLIGPSGESLPGNVSISKRGYPMLISQPVDPPEPYTFDDLPAGTYQVTARALGYGSSTRIISVASGKRLVVDFNLETAGELHGVVVDSAGNPVQGATVTIDYHETRKLHKSEELHFAEGFTITHTGSDRNGFSLLPSVSPDRFFRLVATHDAHTHAISEPISVDPGESVDVGEVKLSPGGVIEVEVSGESVPVVFVLLDQPGGTPHPWNFQRFHRVTSKDGIATSPRWPVGSAVRVFAEAPRRLGADHVIVYEGPVRITLQP